MRAVVLVMVGCSQSMTSAAASDPKPDGGSPAVAVCDPNVIYTPIAFAGTIPTGALDTTLEAYARHFGRPGGTCGEAYIVELSDPSCHMTIELGIHAPFGSGSLSGWALLDGGSETDAVTFIGTADPSTAAAPRIHGRFVSSAPGWSLDLAVDLAPQRSDDCAF